MQIPKGAEKILLKPHGSLVCLVKRGNAYLIDAIKRVAGVNPRVEEDDVVSLNMKLHSILVATTSTDRKLH